MANKKNAPAKPRRASQKGPQSSGSINIKEFPKKAHYSQPEKKEKLTRQSNSYRKPWLFGHNPDLEAKDALRAYQFMLKQEMNRVVKENKLSAINIFMRWFALHRMYAICDIPEDKQSGFLALRFLVTSLQHGIVPPPWVADNILHIINERYREEIVSLDAAFGFRTKGQGKRVSELKNYLTEERNEWIGKSVLALVILGQTLEDAIKRVSKFFLNTKQNKWNHTVYDLQIINLLKNNNNHNDATIKDGLEARIRQLYFQWKRKYPDRASNPAYKKSVLKNPHIWENQFPL